MCSVPSSSGSLSVRDERLRRERLVMEHLPLVGYAVSEFSRRVPGIVTRDELASAGFLGLVSAAAAYDPSRKVPFGAYARTRINGTISDELRSLDWASRGTRRRIKNARTATDSLTAALGRDPSQKEVSELLGVDAEAVRLTAVDAARTVGDLDAEDVQEVSDQDPTPEGVLMAAEEELQLRAGVRTLPERVRYVIEEVYFNDRSVKDIAEEMGRTSSAVSQVRAEGIRLLRDCMSVYETGEGTGAAPDTVSKRRRSDYLRNVSEATAGGIVRQRRTFQS
ncbi:sigma-70 family RNA polymerase sigma factor [Arthrobacter sp. zg-Y1110]|uniref:sigma-70 family RNA polymerase sigma factor n=1 Tax=Arthrobacter sp. zg-Y1110 TaxID=2886932 RepID=UPI001D150AD0|nr:sigma-70 family RNA polymerase sigma factor [Arthrobacter sp. zg-Y1110]MCC3292480.1 sigma-70 family RNA polymerase sigma factor [Arthrobacter sp. zg-Y1110]UWX87087.1 sigma-70 family RNA polymerase sigma factor [Arthrobacter sp. zg-Y1110]